MCFGLVHLYQYADNYFLENFIGILCISLRVQGCTLPLFVACKFAANYNHEPEGRLVRYRCARVLHVRELHPYNCPCSEGTDDITISLNAGPGRMLTSFLINQTLSSLVRFPSCKRTRVTHVHEAPDGIAKRSLYSCVS